ncbi:MAG: tetratricopeptide repeat protein [Actinomycetaceae bacterium]|nr:tetratricopeptide repeat protein [Actinomycetaceae bacterium]
MDAKAQAPVSGDQQDDYSRQATMAIQLAELGQDERAMGILFGLLRQYPERECDTQLILVDINLTAERNEEALISAQRAVACEPDDAQTHKALARSLAALEDFAGAERSARTALRLDGEDARTFVVLAQALHEQGRRDEALAACREALRLDPEDPFAHHLLGVVLTKVDAAAAERELREAFRLDPSLHPVLLQMALVRVKRGDEVGAARVLADVAALTPNDPTVRGVINVFVTRLVHTVQLATLVGLLAAIPAGWIVSAFGGGSTTQASALASVLMGVSIVTVIKVARQLGALTDAFPGGGRLLLKTYARSHRPVVIVAVEIVAVWTLLAYGIFRIAVGDTGYLPLVMFPSAFVSVIGLVVLVRQVDREFG